MARKTKATIAAEAAAAEAARIAAEKPFDLLMPNKALVPAGAVFAAGNYVRIKGVVPADLIACRLPGGSIGVHGASASGTASLCKCSLASPTKDTAPIVAAVDGKPLSGSDAASAVTCRFCAARLVNAGTLNAETLNAQLSSTSRAYALDYGARHSGEALAEIEARAREAAEAIAAAAEKAQQAAEKQARREAREAKQAAKQAPASVTRTSRTKASATK